MEQQVIMMEKIDKEYSLLLEISTDINKAINEELGIADEVKNASDFIKNEIISKLNQENKNIIADGVSSKKINFSEKVFNKTIHFQIGYYNFKDKIYYQKYINKYGDFEGSSVSNDGKFNYIQINFYSISGYIDNKNLSDTIQHELEHIFQQVKAKKSFGGQQLYNYSFQFLNTNNLNDRALAIIVYMSRQSEIDAFINGLYGFLKNGHKLLGSREDIKESPIYQQLVNLKWAKKYIIDNINNIELQQAIAVYQNNYDINYNKFLKLADYAIDNVNQKIGRVIIKYKNDCLKEGVSFRGSYHGYGIERNYYSI